MQVRRVVTGHDESGRSVFASDEYVEPITVTAYPGWAFHPLWGGDSAPAFPDGGLEPPWTTYFPGVDGFRFSLSTIPPADTRSPAEIDPIAAEAELERAMPGMLAYMEPDDPGMHTTETIDFEVILHGEVILELDDGAERLLRAGDTVVQNGTRHRWRNPGAEPALMAVVMVGARRSAST